MRRMLRLVGIGILALSLSAKPKVDKTAHYSVCVQSPSETRCSAKQFTLSDAWEVAQMFLEAPIDATYNVGVRDNLTNKLLKPPEGVQTPEAPTAPPQSNQSNEDKI